MRKYYRAIAKARMRSTGVGSVNKKIGQEVNDEKNWRRIIFGDLAKESEAWQTRNSRKPRRKIKRLAEA